MNIKELTTDKDGSIVGLKKNAKYAVVEVTEHVKVLVQDPASMGTTIRTVATIEEWAPVEQSPASQQKISAKPQGE